MNFEDFGACGKRAVEYVCGLSDKIERKKVATNVSPGYLSKLISKEPPKNGDKLEEILKEIDDKIMPGLTHWQHSGFHAYFPSGRGYSSMAADIISEGLGVVSASWLSSPACTELETIVVDWLGKALSIPPHFYYSSPGGIGGGVIEYSESDCFLMTMLAARTAALKYLKDQSGDPLADDVKFLSKLVAYTSKEAHSALERVARILMVKLRVLDVDDQCSLRGPTLADAIHYDQDKGLHPFFVSCTLGTSASCGFDNLKEIGPIVKKLTQCWLHVDSSYAGCGFICPELRYLKEGLEFADSFSVNCNKWLTVSSDCSCLWVKDRQMLTSALATGPTELQGSNPVDYRHWGLQLSRGFKALKLWMTFRMCGIEGLQSYVRNHYKLAKEFERLVARDGRFELCNDVKVGLVCFRLKGSDEKNQDLLALINSEGKILLVPALIHGKYSIRFCVTHPQANQSHIDFAWSIIQKHTSEVSKQELGEKTLLMKDEERKKFSFIDHMPDNLHGKFKRDNDKDEGGSRAVLNKASEESPKSKEDKVEVSRHNSATKKKDQSELSTDTGHDSRATTYFLCFPSMQPAIAISVASFPKYQPKHE